MGEAQKLFVCDFADCNMSYSAEDHLSDHRSKHNNKSVTDLHLGIFENSIGALSDQTPTPTRFIRNCEEVGLFQDLQNVNPFDETFRNAVEFGNKGLLAVPTTSNEDSLHTPHILPHLEQAKHSNAIPVTTNTDSDIEVLSFNDSECDNANPISLITSDKNKSNPLSLVKGNVLNDTVIKPASPLVFNSGSDKFVKLKLKQIFRKKATETTKAIGIPNKQLEIAPIVNGATTILLNTPTLIAASNSILRRKVLGKSSCDNSNKQVSNENLERKREVNRAAQTRSRVKKKMIQNQMEKEMRELKAGKRELFLENKRLRQEIITLKTVLLYHQHCSVTRNPEKRKEITETINAMKAPVTDKPLRHTKDTNKTVPIQPNTSNLKVSGMLIPVVQVPIPSVLVTTPSVQSSNDKT